jgi:superfamily II DNA or RNA helicase
MTLRDYQLDAVARALDAVARRVSAVVHLPTGAGKTQVAAEVVRRLARPVVFVAHRRELIAQAAARLESFGVPCGRIVGGAPRTDHAVQVASVQSLARAAVLPPAAVLIVDEAHRAVSATYTALFAKAPDVPRLGLTATPFRLDGRGLRGVFDEIITGPTVAQLVTQGFLKPARVYVPPGPDLSAVPKRAGDFAQDRLGQVMRDAKLIGDLVEHFRRHGAPPAILFATGIEHSEECAAAFRFQGIPAEHLDGGTDLDVRAAALARLASGETKIICNADLFGEGYDLPAIRTVILARPTASLALFLQQIGRGARPAPGKDCFTVLDHGGNYARHFARLTFHWLPDRRSNCVDVLGVTLDGPPPKPPKETEAAVRRCPACFVFVVPGDAVCWSCGAAVPPPAKKKPPANNSDDLVPLSPEERAAASWADRRAWWLVHQNDKNLAANFRAKFGHLPPVYHGQFLDPEDPALESLRRRLLQSTTLAIGDRAYFVVRAKFAGQWPA